MADTGNGASFVLSGGFTASVVTLGGAEIELPAVKTSYLGTATRETYMPGDLREEGEQEFEIQYNPNSRPPIGTVQTLTLTYPVPSGLSSGGTKTGTGFVKKWKEPDLKNNELMMAKVIWIWDGLTGPTYANAS